MNKKILLIISGSVAAYKALEIVRALKDKGVAVNCILTKGGEQFVTPLAVSAVSGTQTYTELFSLKDETEMGHIRLTREADLVVVAPASANMIAKMANGYADDLASAALLASDKPVLLAPAMNTKMWEHAATQRNVAQLRADGIDIIEPESGELACGEIGFGRLATPQSIVEKILARLSAGSALKGKKALVTAGPTHEPLDPVRYIANRSSGKQGFAIAAALANAGADVTLIAGPTHEPLPAGVKTIRVETAQQMLLACENALPADIAIFTAAVADWRAAKPSAQKIKKSGKSPELALAQNPDILHSIATHKKRPKLVVGFAAETENLEKNARAKLKSKQADWIIANDVSNGKVFGENNTSALFIDAKTSEKWEVITKPELANRLIQKITHHFGESHDRHRLKITTAR